MSTFADIDALFNVSVEHVSLKDEMDSLVKAWDESTERYHAAAGTDNINGNLQQQAAQAKHDAQEHSKATAERTQRTADTSKEAAQQYSSTDGENGVAITKVGDHVVNVQPVGSDGHAAPAAGGPAGP